MKRSLILFFSIICCGACLQAQTATDNGLPVIRIDTRDGVEVLSKEQWTNIQSFDLTDATNPENNITRTNLPKDDRIRGRGNTTWSYAKKPYRLRFRETVSFFGLPAAENWVLLAEYLDPTFLINATAFYLGRNVFDLPYTCSYQPVELYINGRYDGVYGFTEHRQADPLGIGAPGRPKIDAENGWFVELDYNWDESPKFKTTSYMLPIMIKSPEAADNASNDENPFYDFIKNDWNELCNLMSAPDFPENGYRDLIDMSSFVDYLMINEIVGNDELWWPKSVFAYKDMNGKICLGPMWDFDWAFDYAGEGHIYFEDYAGRLGKHAFFDRFFEDPFFVSMYKNRWNEKRTAIADVSTFISAMGEKIEPAANNDTERWKIDGGYRNDYPEDYLAEINKMTMWWSNRLDWLDDVISIPSANSGEVLPETQIKAWIQKGKLHVTGLATGEEWSLFDITGRVLRRGIAEKDETAVNLTAKGIYIMLCGNNIIKVGF